MRAGHFCKLSIEQRQIFKAFKVHPDAEPARKHPQRRANPPA
jgi:hypothetical protein